MARVVPAPVLRDLTICVRRMEYGRALRQQLQGLKPMQTPYTRPIRDAVALFDELAIGYALVGGVAAMYYGRARFTEDVDFVAGSDHQQVLAAHPQLMKAHRFDPACTYKLYHTSGVEIDLWKDEFADQIIARAQVARLNRLSIRIANPNDLVAMKLRAGRLQDDYDISEIAKHTPLDHKAIRGQVTAEQFDHFGSILARA